MFQTISVEDDWQDKALVDVTHNRKLVSLGIMGDTDVLLLTPKQSKAIRKALKRAEQYLEENSDVRS